MSKGQKLTKRVVDAASAADGDLFVWDTEVVGFGLRVKPSGTKSFIFRYRPASGGNDRKLTIGRFPATTVEAARGVARELYVEKMRGADPAIDRRRARDAITVRQLADYYVGPHCATKGNRLSTVREYRRALDKVVIPRLGSRKLDQVGMGEVADIMHLLVATPVLANRIRAVMSGMFEVAVTMGWAKVNPCSGIPTYREKPRERFLTPEEQRKLVAYLASHRNQTAADVVRLLLLTGARRGEVLGSTWDMFDLRRRLWIKPSHHTKQDRTHVVALGDEAVALIERRKARWGAASLYLFPQRADATKPIVGIKKFWSELQRDLCMHDFRVHDLRHTSASVLLSAGHTLAEVGHALGHTQSRTTERYAHMFDENKHQTASTLNAAFGSPGAASR